MHIDPNEEILGYPATQLRKLLKYSQQHGALFLDDVERILQIPKKTAKDLAKDLISQSYIIKHPMQSDLNCWLNTIKGNALANASAAKPVLRATAEKALSEFLERVKEINQSDAFICGIQKVIIFGSYLGDSPVVSDVDIAIDIQQKNKFKDSWEEASQNNIQQADDDGRIFNSYLEQLFWPHQQVMLYAKNRSRVISLHRIQDEGLLLTGIAQKVLLETIV